MSDEKKLDGPLPTGEKRESPRGVVFTQTATGVVATTMSTRSMVFVPCEEICRVNGHIRLCARVR